MNKPDLLIQIEVSRSKESTDCEFSTGYPIGRDRIITAAHVLNQEFKSPYIEAFFRDPEHPGSYLCSTCEIVWDGRKDRGPDAAVDVAVLRCQLPDKFAAEIPVLEQAPLALVKAHAQGYPAITRKGKRQSPLAAFGEFAPIPTGQMEIELHCSDALRDTQNWKGVSGAPVFVEDHFAGIIYEYRRTHRFDHFGAIAIFRLLEDEQFQIAIGWPDSKDEAYRRKTQAGIKARLKKLSGQVEDDYEDRTILDWLLQKLGLSVSGTPDDNKCEVAATFLTQPREETLPQLIEMHLRLCDLDQKENASTLGAVIDMVTPLQFPPDLWRKVREQIAARRPLVRGAAAGIVTAETVATRIDASEKPSSVKLTKGSAGGLTSPHLMLSTSFKPDVGPLGNPGSELGRFVRELYAATHSDISLAFDRMVDQLRGEYKTHKGIHHRSPFVLVSMPGKPEDQEAWLRVLAEVKKRLEHVILIEISDSSEAHTLEGILFKCLNTRLASEKKWDRT